MLFRINMSQLQYNNLYPQLYYFNLKCEINGTLAYTIARRLNNTNGTTTSTINKSVKRKSKK